MNKAFRRQIAIAASLRLLNSHAKRGPAGQVDDHPTRIHPGQWPHATLPDRYRATAEAVRHHGLNE